MCVLNFLQKIISSSPVLRRFNPRRLSTGISLFGSEDVELGPGDGAIAISPGSDAIVLDPGLDGSIAPSGSEETEASTGTEISAETLKNVNAEEVTHFKFDIEFE